jgi:hypothetical protein
VEHGRWTRPSLRDLLSIHLYVSFPTFPFLLRVCRSTAMCTAPLLRDILFYRLCYRSSHSLCLSVEAAIRLHINFRLVRLHCTGSVETPGFTPKSPSRFSFFFCFFCWQRFKEKFSSKIFLLEEKRALSPLVFRPTYLFRNRWLPTKFPFLLARRQARARLLREYSILSGESSLTFFFSSESTVPRAFADRFVRVKSIYYLVPGIFVFAETLWMVCCIVSVWKI